MVSMVYPLSTHQKQLYGVLEYGQHGLSAGVPVYRLLVFWGCTHPKIGGEKSKEEIKEPHHPKEENHKTNYPQKKEKNMSEQWDGLYEEAKVKGLIEGIHIGESRVNRTAAINMSRKGKAIEDIADILEVSVEKIKEWIKESTQPEE